MPKADSETPRDLMVGKDILLVLGHRWFEKQLGSALDRGLAELLIAVYLHSEKGTPLSKKTALQYVSVSDVKTARKYLGRCIELEWIETTRSQTDKRVDLLRPSESMREVIKEELLQIGEILQKPERRKELDWGDPVIRLSKSDLRLYTGPHRDDTQTTTPVRSPNPGTKKK